ncbi:MAG: hypothetical protein K2Q22_12630, partial [Cytophagales bacterium]|nr:hypothetical protein [Cytophagales bacterium]
RKCTQKERSLDDLMRLLWKDFGHMKQGYTPEQYQKSAEKIAGKSLKKYFLGCIHGSEGLGTFLSEALDYLGLQLRNEENESYHASNFGFLTQWKDGQHSIKLIEPNSPADNRLAIGDIIHEINGMIPDSQLDIPLFCTETIFLQIQRNGKNKMISLSATLKTFLTKTRVSKKKNPTEKELENYRTWMGR